MAHTGSKSPISRLIPLLCILLVGSGGVPGFTLRAIAQIRSFPYHESFETVTPPVLPGGWTSSRNKSSGNDDFVTSTGTAHSGGNAVLATNATIAQELVSPVVDFTGRIPDHLTLYLRRSSTFRAPVVVEASIDGGSIFSIVIGDTLRPTGSVTYVYSSAELPAVLSGLQGVHFRWRVIPDTAGTTGTLRLDDITLSARPASDIALSSIDCEPKSPTVDDPVVASVTLRNGGEPSARPLLVHICRDANGDSVAQHSEIMSSVCSALPIPSKDSIELKISLGRLAPGDALLIAVLDDSLDQDHANDTLLLPLVVGHRRGTLFINEIMYAPATPEPEWVELVNARADTVSLRNWLLTDAGITTRHPITQQAMVCPPGGYVLLTRDSSALAEVHPSMNAPIIAVPGFPSLNNGGDAVVVFDCTGRCMDSVVYSPAWGGASLGRSLERIDVDAASDSRVNWASSKDSNGCTPGLPNSIARKEVDIALDSLRFSPVNPRTGDFILITTNIRNVGRQSVLPEGVDILFDANRDSLVDIGERIGTIPVNAVLLPLDSLAIAWTYQPRRSGAHRFVAMVQAIADQGSDNNTAAGVVMVNAEPSALRINEVMFDPLSGGPEWVELVNVSNDSVDLNDWQVGNHSVSSHHRIDGAAAIVSPLSYGTITKDTTALAQSYGGVEGRVVQIASLPTYFWSNSGDGVVLATPQGVTVDSMWYRSYWAGGGTSLERLDPAGVSLDSANWRASADSLRATPGRRNSRFLLPLDLRIGSVQAQWVAGDESVWITLNVVNAGKTTFGKFGVAIYDDADADSVAQQEELVNRSVIIDSVRVHDSIAVKVPWKTALPGIHRLVVVVESPEDERLGDNIARCVAIVPFEKRSMVINEIMYDPRPGCAEYIELLNVSGHDLDLAEWTIADRPPPGGGGGHIRLSATTCRIRDGELLTVASDSSILKTFPATQSAGPTLLRLGGWTGFGLSNSGDDIVVRDPTGNLIDSVAYLPAWHRGSIVDVSGRSLERIQAALSTNDARNWSTSVSPRGGTPCGQNSIHTESGPRRMVLSFTPNPFSPDGDGVEDFAVIQYELPGNVAMVNIKIFDVKGRLVRWLANNEPSGGCGEIIWNGCDDEQRQVRIGIYVVLLEARDERGSALTSARGALVVAGRL